MAFLDTFSIGMTVELERCLSERDLLRGALDDANAARDSLEAEQLRLTGAIAQIEDSIRLVSDAQRQRLIRERDLLAAQADSVTVRAEEQGARIDSLTSQRDSAEVRVDSLAGTLVEQSADFAQRRRLFIGIAAGLGVAALLLILLLVRNRRKARDEIEETQAQLDEAHAEVARQSVVHPDLALVGEGFQGEPIRLRISGSALTKDASGVIVGRSARQANCVLMEDSVSRSHASIRLSDGQLVIEDLGSMNGTFVEGTRLKPGQKRQIRHGTTIQLGDVKLKMTVMSS